MRVLSMTGNFVCFDLYRTHVIYYFQGIISLCYFVLCFSAGSGMRGVRTVHGEGYNWDKDLGM